MNSKTFTFIVVAFVLLTIAGQSIAQGTAVGKKIEELKKNQRKRNVQYSSNQNGFKIAVTAINADKEKAKRWVFRAKRVPSPEVGFYLFKRSSASKTNFFFRTRFHSLAEHQGSPNGTIVKTVNLMSKTWTAFKHTKRDLGDAVIHSWMLNTTDNLMAIRLQIATAPKDDGQPVKIRPEALKMDVYINNFPFTANGNYLALRSWVATVAKTTVKANLTDDNLIKVNKVDAVEFDETSDGLKGRFSWLKTVTIDGSEYDVTHSQLATATVSGAATFKNTNEDKGLVEGSRTVNVKGMSFYFHKPSPWTSLSWDPDFGTTDETYDEESSASSTLISMATIVIFAIVSVFMM